MYTAHLGSLEIRTFRYWFTFMGAPLSGAKVSASMPPVSWRRVRDYWWSLCSIVSAHLDACRAGFYEKRTSLRGQRQVLFFLRKYAQHVGGNENECTLGGLSAGAHTVDFHLSDNYDDESGRPLFSKAIMASGSPAGRAFPGAEYPLHQKQYQEFMDRIRCAWPRTAALPCLRSADVFDIQFVSSAIYSAYEHNITWPRQPVSSCALLDATTSSSTMNSISFAIDTPVSSTTDDGSCIVPPDPQTNNDFVAIWRNLAPGLPADDLNDLQRLYPEPSNGLTNSSDLSFVSTQFQRVSAACDDYSYTCPVQDTALRLSRGCYCVQSAIRHSRSFSRVHRRPARQRRRLFERPLGKGGTLRFRSRTVSFLRASSPAGIQTRMQPLAGLYGRSFSVKNRSSWSSLHPVWVERECK